MSSKKAWAKGDDRPGRCYYFKGALLVAHEGCDGVFGGLGGEDVSADGAGIDHEDFLLRHCCDE